MNEHGDAAGQRTASVEESPSGVAVSGPETGSRRGSRRGSRDGARRRTSPLCALQRILPGHSVAARGVRLTTYQRSCPPGHRFCVDSLAAAVAVPTVSPDGVQGQALEWLSRVGGQAGSYLPGDARSWAVAGAVAAAAVVMSAMGRAKLIRRGLRRRIAIAMVPTSTFDPSLEDVLRFASQLVRIRPATRWLSPRAASCVRIRFVSIPGGRLVVELEGPVRSRSVLRLGSYSQVDLRPVEALRPPPQADEAKDPAKPEAGAA